MYLSVSCCLQDIKTLTSWRYFLICQKIIRKTAGFLIFKHYVISFIALINFELGFHNKIHESHAKILIHKVMIHYIGLPYLWAINLEMFSL